MVYELWSSEQEGSYSFFPVDESMENKRPPLANDAKLVWVIEARSSEEANALKHKYLGWEPYIPMS